VSQIATKPVGRRLVGATVAVLTIAALALTSAAVSSASTRASGKISSKVQSQLAAHGATSFWIVLGPQANLSSAPAIKDWNVRGAFVVNSLRGTADRTQTGLRRMLTTRGVQYKTYWASNVMLVYKADKATALAIASRPEVSRLEPRFTAHVIDGLKATPSSGRPQTPEWNLVNVKAPDVWSQFSDRGAGIVVASEDTGVQYDHPALVKQYRGNKGNGVFNHNYNWFDPLHACPGHPCDTFGHGTHTMGTMVGYDGGQNEVGVAPEAQWIETDPLPDGNGTDQALLDAGQWLLAPTKLDGSDPKPSMRPDVVNNSWGIPFDDQDTWYRSTVSAWIAAGIFPAWAAGNEGPSCSSLREPGAYPKSYTMGAHDINNVIASFSSRGPSPFNHNQTVKPDITAPGVNVRSSIPTNSYANFSGTSMATPHVAGIVALMWSAAPTLRGNVGATKKILNSTGHPVSNLACGGTKGDNNVWGHGRVDALAAVTAAIGLEASRNG
jgi:subtilisin family serine protease